MYMHQETFSEMCGQGDPLIAAWVRWERLANHCACPRSGWSLCMWEAQWVSKLWYWYTASSHAVSCAWRPSTCGSSVGGSGAEATTSSSSRSTEGTVLPWRGAAGVELGAVAIGGGTAFPLQTRKGKNKHIHIQTPQNHALVEIYSDLRCHHWYMPVSGVHHDHMVCNCLSIYSYQLSPCTACPAPVDGVSSVNLTTDKSKQQVWGMKLSSITPWSEACWWEFSCLGDKKAVTTYSLLARGKRSKACEEWKQKITDWDIKSKSRITALILKCYNKPIRPVLDDRYSH